MGDFIFLIDFGFFGGFWGFCFFGVLLDLDFLGFLGKFYD